MRCKTNKPMRVRIGPSEKCIFKSLIPGEVYDLPEGIIKSRDLIRVTEMPKTTEGKIGKKKVETKQIDSSYEKLLRKIKGIGIKTVKDILKVFPSKESMKRAVEHEESMPFDDDVEKKLRSKKW